MRRRSQDRQRRGAAGMDMYHVVTVLTEKRAGRSVEVVGEPRGMHGGVQLKHPAAARLDKAAERFVAAVLRDKAVDLRLRQLQIPQAVEDKQLLAAEADDSAKQL